MFKKVQIIFLILIFNLSACGYKLNHEIIFSKIKEINLDISNPSLEENLKNNFLNLGINISENAEIKLLISQYNLQEILLAQSENNHGKFLKSHFFLSLEDKDKKLINKEISNQVFINFNKNEILGNLKEFDNLKQELIKKDIQSINLILSAFYEN